MDLNGNLMSQRDKIPKPGVAGLPRDGCAVVFLLRRSCVPKGLVPNVSLVVVDPVLPKHDAKFVLEAELAVMSFLIGNGFFDSAEIGRAHREDSVTRLPGKALQSGVLRRRSGFFGKGRRSLVEKTRWR